MTPASFSSGFYVQARWWCPPRCSDTPFDTVCVRTVRPRIKMLERLQVREKINKQVAMSLRLDCDPQAALHCSPVCAVDGRSTPIRRGEQKSRLLFVGTHAPRRHLSSEVVCAGGLPARPGPRLSSARRCCAGFDVPQTLNHDCGADQEGLLASPLPGRPG